jgi:hypothetical protein
MNRIKQNRFIKRWDGFVERFIKKAIGKHDIKIIYFSDKKEAEAAKVDARFHEIFLNCHVMRRFNRVWVRAVILHELGHIFTKPGRSSARSEYMANMWGIHKAYQMALQKEAQMLKESFERWKDFEWNSENRKYVLAHKMAKKKGVI